MKYLNLPYFKMSHFNILMIIIIIISSGYCTNDHRGTEFIFTFNCNVKNEKAVLVFISQEATTIRIKSSHQNLFTSIQMKSNSEERLNLKDGFSLNTTSIAEFIPKNIGIHVESTKNVTLYAYSIAPYSSTGFLVLPINVLSTEYIAVTYMKATRALSWNIISIVATTNNTTVSIAFGKSENLNCISTISSDGVMMMNKMNTLDVIAIACKEDLTGTVIRSNKNVVVLSGNTFTPIPTGISIGDAIQEMLIPTVAYGFTYYLHSFCEKVGMEHRIVSGSDDNIITFHSGNALNMSFAEFHVLETAVRETFFFQCSKPCMVMSFGKVNWVTTERRDAYMTITQAVEHYQYHQSSRYLVPSARFEDNAKITTFFNTNYTKQLRNNTYVYQDASECNDGVFDIADNQVLSLEDLAFPTGQIVRGIDNKSISAFGHPSGFTFDIDNCKVNECLNGATCQDQFYSFACNCREGYNGTLCENDIDECFSSPCQNNATCLDVTNGFVCQCEPGFSGLLCETDIDECQSNPCPNNGTCTDLINEFHCRCPLGFLEPFCEIGTGISSSEMSTSTDVIFQSENQLMPSLNFFSSETTLVLEPSETATPLNAVLSTDPSAGPFSVTTDITISSLFQSTLSSAVIDTGSSAVPVTQRNWKPICVCVSRLNSSMDKIQQRSQRMYRSLVLDKSKLTKTIIKHISLPDNRPTAIGIGTLGCILMVVSFLIVLIPDLIYLLREFHRMNSRNGH